MDTSQNNADAEDKRKHLEFIQAIITRMSQNSFLVKGWTVTLVAALFALAEKKAIRNLSLFRITLQLFFGYLTVILFIKNGCSEDYIRMFLNKILPIFTHN